MPEKNQSTNVKADKIEAGEVYAISVLSATPDSWIVTWSSKLVSWCLQPAPLTALKNLGVIDTDLYSLIEADIDTKKGVVIFSTLDYAQKEMGCSFI